jgi:GNAT superfamily N-acetyltransferase
MNNDLKVRTQSAETTLRPMHAGDLVAMHGLAQRMSWPHRPEDCAQLLALGAGTVAVDAMGRTVGVGLRWSFGRDVGTIGLVLVAPDQQGRGIGRALMKALIADSEPRTLMLNATAEGLPLYEKLGFVTIGEIVQHQGQASYVDGPENVSWSHSGDHACLVALDHVANGHERSALMRVLRERAKFAVIREENAVQAFAAIREFGRGLVIGPVVARHDIEAKALIDFLLAHHQGMFVRIDTDMSINLAEWLTSRELTHVGGGITMRRSTRAQQNKRAAARRMYALVSQALG